MKKTFINIKKYKLPFRHFWFAFSSHKLRLGGMPDPLWPNLLSLQPMGFEPAPRQNRVRNEEEKTNRKCNLWFEKTERKRQKGSLYFFFKFLFYLQKYLRCLRFQGYGLFTFILRKKNKR